MDFLLNVAIWALLLVHVDSALGGKGLSSVDHPTLPDVNGGAPEFPATVLGANQSNTNGSTQSAAVPTVVSLSKTIPPNEETNTGNATSTESTVPVSLTPSTSTTATSTTSTSTNSTGTTSSSTTSSSTASTSGATTTHSSVAPTTVHLDPSQPLSSTQSPGTSTTDSARPDLNLTTTATSHHTQPTASTAADLHDSIKPMGDSSTQQHREPSSTAHPDTPTTTSRAAHPAPTATPLGTSSAPANARADTPSQLSMGGGATVVHETAAVDPLLAGLVSAFIITAVIVTLLLFLKLRRRDNRPEFRRLQDLPMDDMMEDTPLSMYSY